MGCAAPVATKWRRGWVMSDKISLTKELYDVLKEAEAHLDYCGYGDSWERECAKASRLEERIAAALARYEGEGNE
jgi:hypothetical protein